MAHAVCALLLFLLHHSSLLLAQDATPSPTPDKRGVQLLFAPPPMQGTISMGIYDSTGKLVRTLHQDAPTSDFFPALNGLITFWDGKDDSGKLMPAGKYRAKGLMMGEMDFEGVAFLGNDFVDKDGNVQLHRIKLISATSKGNCCLIEIPTHSGVVPPLVSLDPSGNPVDDHDFITPKLSVVDGKIIPSGGDNVSAKPIHFPAIEHPVAVSDGREGTFWVIDGTDVKQVSADGLLLRHLATKAGDPAPTGIAASPVADEIYLLEQNDKLQRVRGLALVSGTDSGASPAPAPQPSPAGDTPQKSSLWKVMFTKTINFSDKLEQALPLLKMSDGKPFAPQDKITIKLLPNLLNQGKQDTVDIAIGIDAKGSFLKTTDGLPLCSVSGTPNLKWAAMALEADGKTVTIFQSDGAVVEQFKASKLDDMAAFDAGDFDFDPASVK